MRKEKILALTTFAILLASCSNDDEIPRFENLEGTPIVIKAGVNNMITRAGWDSSNLPDRFIVSIDQDGTEYDYENVMMYRKCSAGRDHSHLGLKCPPGHHQGLLFGAHSTDFRRR